MNIIGIYLLHFGDPDACYIGQSTHITRRVTEHNRLLRLGTHYNKKLQSAYNAVKVPPILEIIEKCNIVDLDTKEAEYIIEFDSINRGYNIVNYGSGGRGVASSKSKYTEEQILNIFFELLDPEMTNLDIAKKLYLPVTLVECVAYNKRHAWVSEAYPELREEINKIIKSNIRFKSSNNINKRNGVVYTLLSPLNELFSFSNITQFAKENFLNTSHVCQLLKNNVKHHKGWKLPNKETEASE